ncbi:response regulator [Falsiroseomonas sp.]|uniref:response regulator n=1 Tax=Falsiroseomonas sp. TaxID=2870721 RepID=UPI0035674DDB
MNFKQRFWNVSAPRLHAVLIAVSVLVPAALFAFAAMQNRADVLREGEDTVVRTAAILHEHARKVFETQELALARLHDRLRGLSWEQIAAPETSAFLAELQAPLEQAVSMWVADRNGVVRAGSRPWDPGMRIDGREFFRVHAEGDPGPHVSAAFRGRATGVASFALSRPLTTPDGAFDGTIHIALSPEYFSRFFAEAAPPMAHAAALLRSDGAVLAREPAGGPDRLGPDSPLLRAIAVQPSGGVYSAVSTIDGAARIYAYRKVGDYPLYVGFGVQRAAVLGRWYANLRLYGGVAAAAAGLLLLVSWLAMRRALAERAATVRLRHALDDLKRETAGREAAEIRVRQAQRMEALGQLAGGIAHDVNNVLQAAASGARLIGRRPDDAEQVRRLAAMVLEATERGASVARRLLAFARQGELRAADVDAAAMLDDLKAVLGHTLGASVEVRTAIAGSLPPLRADKGQLETVLLNLATNARDAMAGRDGGVLTLAAAEDRVAPGMAHPAGLAPGAYLRLAVADTGAGMDAATLARATEPFFTTKPPGRGTGLGLAMAKGFAEQSGGGLAIDSEEGRGTTVTLWLPRGAGAAAGVVAGGAQAAPARVDGAPRVLLVDDEALVRETLGAELTERGWQVLEVADGAAALHALDIGALQPDLLVTDLSMPGMSGLALIREMRRRRPGLPTVLLTGLMGDGAAAQAALAEVVRDGPFALLRKPLDARELVARAEALLHAAGEAAASR